MKIYRAKQLNGENIYIFNTIFPADFLKSLGLRYTVLRRVARIPATLGTQSINGKGFDEKHDYSDLYGKEVCELMNKKQPNFETLRACGNCHSYKGKLSDYAGLKMCGSCISKLEAKREKKAQIAFDFVGNQNSLFSLLLIVVLMFSACGSRVASKEAQNAPEQRQSERVKEATSHLCNFPLKDNRKCARKVSNDKGEFCFQHRGGQK